MSVSGSWNAFAISTLRDWKNPGGYFHGLSEPGTARVDNVLAFKRLHTDELGAQAHSHGRWVWIVPVEGEAMVVMDGRFVAAVPGVSVLVPPRIPHCYAVGRGRALAWWFITFEASPRASPTVGPKELGTAGALALSATEEERIDACLQAIRDANAAEACLWLALALESRRRQNPHFKGRTEPLLDRIHRWAEDPSGEDFSVGGLASWMGGSESHLRALFRKRHGMSLGRYLHHLRMRKACMLLTRGELPVIEVAWACGYAAPGNFTRAFKRETGITPRKYRQAPGPWMK